VSRGILYTVAATCALVATIVAATVIVALFEPPAWNRAHRAGTASAWFYVSYIHWCLARCGAEPSQKPGRLTRWRRRWCTWRGHPQAEWSPIVVWVTEPDRLEEDGTIVQGDDTVVRSYRCARHDRAPGPVMGR